jgi:rod shape-determining protein MreC
VVLVMVSLTFVTVDSRANDSGALNAIRNTARDVLAPLQSAIGGIADPVADFADSLVNSSDISAENRRLREENDRLRGQLTQTADADRQRKVLLDLNKLDFAGDIPRVAARVINTAPSNLSLTVEIDRGSDQGVAPDMPVVIGAGLVGTIERTTGTRSVVRLLTDENLHVAVRLISTGTQCVVNGGGRDKPLDADLVDPETQVQADDGVVTSGLAGGRFPPGLPVGRITGAKIVPGVRYQDVDVEPAVDFNRLEYVSVLVWRGS